MTFIHATITQSTPTAVGQTITLGWTAIVGDGPYAGTFESFSIFRDGVDIMDGVDPSATSYVDIVPQANTTYVYEIQGQYTYAPDNPVISNDESIESADSRDSDFNCECETTSPYDTLANVRQRMIIRLGYPNQATNPPPGLAALVDEHLRNAQREIYRQVQRAAQRTERFFYWTMVPGQRFYGLSDNENACVETLDPLKITWVGFEDLNLAWYRLDEGIPPEYYTRANINFGWPTRYEIRSCIEIFPAPQAAYTLWVKGDFGLGALVADSDHFTIDDEACFLLALGNAKAEKRQPDAQLVLTQAGNYIKGLVAGAHGTRRYVPRSETESPLTPPKFLPLGGSTS